MYPLLETIRISNGHAMFVDYHQQRMDSSYKALFGFSNPFSLDEILSAERFPSGRILKCRLLYGKEVCKSSYAPYKYREVNSLKIIHCDNIEYGLKYTDRKAIESLFAKRAGCDDILIVKKGLLTDTSFSNIAFYDGEIWWTPARPLLKGCCRQRLLDQAKIKKTIIKEPDIKCFQSFRLLNAMLDFEGQSEKDVSGIVF